MPRKSDKNFAPWVLNPSFPAEEAIKYARHHYGGYDNYGEAPPNRFHAAHKVHTKDTGYKRREHQYDGY